MSKRFGMNKTWHQVSLSSVIRYCALHDMWDITPVHTLVQSYLFVLLHLSCGVYAYVTHDNAH